MYAKTFCVFAHTECKLYGAIKTGFVRNRPQSARDVINRNQPNIMLNDTLTNVFFLHNITYRI